MRDTKLFRFSRRTLPEPRDVRAFTPCTPSHASHAPAPLWSFWSRAGIRDIKLFRVSPVATFWFLQRALCDAVTPSRAWHAISRRQRSERLEARGSDRDTHKRRVSLYLAPSHSIARASLHPSHARRTNARSMPLGASSLRSLCRLHIAASRCLWGGGFTRRRPPPPRTWAPARPSAACGWGRTGG
jgi:hypothetical protein